MTRASPSRAARASAPVRRARSASRRGGRPAGRRPVAAAPRRAREPQPAGFSARWTGSGCLASADQRPETRLDRGSGDGAPSYKSCSDNEIAKLREDKHSGDGAPSYKSCRSRLRPATSRAVSPVIAADQLGAIAGSRRPGKWFPAAGAATLRRRQRCAACPGACFARIPARRGPGPVGLRST
jgi:hypothetical protein